MMMTMNTLVAKGTLSIIVQQDFVLLSQMRARRRRRNDAGIGIYIVIGIFSHLRTGKVVLIGEGEEMANNAGIGIEFRGKKLFLPISHQQHLCPPLHDHKSVLSGVGLQKTGNLFVDVNCVATLKL